MRMTHEEALRRGLINASDVPAEARGDKPRRGEIEGEEQAVVIEGFRSKHPDVGPLLIHIPNGGSRSNAFEGYRLKRQGVRAGVSDLLLPVARGGYFGLWIEFKAAPPNNAAVTKPQKEWIDEMERQGYRALVCLGVESALSELDAYLALPATQVIDP